ncbi:chaperone NapD [Paracoccus lutimaris]|uniref:Chaperone NapD n=1 Tax=Paracoccus lutimaris TaxID=1490030 RepID=A0A368Z741_9RHOB|nr:chaperone NapD [Paracoccus lutimaris]RCW88272.1 periplasmic nitrate reductase chaperone NapD [Paracoccus lutimaris]
MPEPGRYHISSAVVSIVPGRETEVLSVLPSLPGVELHMTEGSRAVVTIEGRSLREMGDRLTDIAKMDGVVAANMVFEHSEEEEPLA